MQHVHFIGIGGTTFLDLAIAVSRKNGYKVTVSGENLPEVTLERLNQYGLAPDRQGWFPEYLTRNISAIVYGSEVHNDNPELIKARELGLKIYSSPEYLFVQTRNKTRIVVAGSHGKTTITALILYVMKQLRMEADFLIGERPEGYTSTVRLSYESRIAVFDGDEKLSSSIDRRPKFHLYKPHIAILTGIDRDCSTTFPDFDVYVDQFDQFINLMETQGRLIYFDGDPALAQLTSRLRRDIVAFPFNTPTHIFEDGICYLKTRRGNTAVPAISENKLRCIQAALLACKQVGINEDQFFSVIGGFPVDQFQKLTTNS
jgi:UDP-N-acetylmuramate: L-alanyl-gamma-D-glutamyl-meso-diaminopimelate ligase